MKKAVIVLALIFFCVQPATADLVTLATPEAVDSPVAPQLHWYVSMVDAQTQRLEVRYRWLDSSGRPIRDADSSNSWHTWACVTRAPQLAAECTGIGAPYGCCTGEGTADETCDAGATCFSDIFRFKIRSQDVGKSIGFGLRSLIWSKLQGDVLSPGNSGTFDVTE